MNRKVYIKKNDSQYNHLYVLFLDSMSEIGNNTVYIDEWDSSISYKKGRVCTSSGVEYISLADNNLGNSITDSSKWKANGPTGYTWNTASSYSKNQVSWYEGNKYISLIDSNKGNAPSNHDGKWAPCQLGYETDSQLEFYRKYVAPYFEVGFITEKDIVGNNIYVSKITATGETSDGTLIYNYTDSQNTKNEYSGINYSDTGGTSATATIYVNGLNPTDFSHGHELHRVENDHISELPKINGDIFIDRGDFSSNELHMRLGELNSVSDIEKKSFIFNLK